MDFVNPKVVGKRQLYRRVNANVEKITSLCENSLNTPDTKYSQINTNGLISSSNIERDTDLVADNLTQSTVSNTFNFFDENINPIVSEITESVHEKEASTESDEISDELPSKLRHWALNVPQVKVTELLHILSPYHPNLPLDCRTLLKTPKTYSVKKLDSGEYSHIGLANNLKQCLTSSKHLTLLGNEIFISFNIDGIPLFHSTNLQFWPILGRIVNNNIKLTPFVIGIFCGMSKPVPLKDFLEDFINELTHLLTEGINIENKNYSVICHNFICDAPARAYIKCIKSHGGYSSCDKCVEPGEYINGRVVLLGTTARRRTDDSFIAQVDEDHHIGISPLVALSIGLVSCFPIDYMHSVCLGVTRKLLNSWVSGNLKTRSSGRDIKRISGHLVSLRQYVPREINRKPRELAELARWKATEFRSFLLYLGPVVLRDVLPRRLYEHFLLLHCGIFILCSNKLIQKIGHTVANNLLIAFINDCKVLYGREYLVYNVHTLSHLCSDVEKYGPLDHYSAFPFENYLGCLKRMIRSPKKPLAQILRRLQENMLAKKTVSDSNRFQFSGPHENGPVPFEDFTWKQFKKISFKNSFFAISTFSLADSFCLMDGNMVVQIHNILVNSEDIAFVIGKEFTKSDFFL